MGRVDTHEILRLAAEDAEQAYNDNLYREPSMRMSRAGLPLLQLVLEDFIIPKLPKLAGDEDQPLNTGLLNKRLRRLMALSTGYLYEKAVGSYLSELYPGYQVWSQTSLEYKGITGTCDFLLLNEIEQSAIVIECKALDVDSLKSAKESKLLTDNWGYLTQLALYGAAVKDKYPEFTVDYRWFVWAKKISKSFVYKPSADFDECVQKALDRAVVYSLFQQAFRHNELNLCCSYVLGCLEFDHMPPKGFYQGYLSASCGFHFSPWSAALLDNDGFPLDDFEQRLRTLIEGMLM